VEMDANHSALADVEGIVAPLTSTLTTTLDTLILEPWRHEDLANVLLGVLLLTFVAELVSWRSVRRIVRSKGVALYLTAVFLTVLNTCLFAPIPLTLVTHMGWLRPPMAPAESPELQFAQVVQAGKEILFLVVVHSFGAPSPTPHRRAAVATTQCRRPATPHPTNSGGKKAPAFKPPPIRVCPPTIQTRTILHDDGVVASSPH
jgi:hypothetical protein